MPFPPFIPPVIPTPIPPGTVGKITQFFNVGRQGWTESYYVNVVGGSDPLLLIEAAGKMLNQMRRTGLAENVNLEAMRYSIVGFPRLADLDYAPNFGLGTGQINANCTAPWMAWLLEFQDPTATISDRRLYRGWDQADLATGTIVNGIALTTPPKVTQFLTNMRSVLRVPYTSPAGGTVQFGMVSYDRTTPTLALAQPGGVTPTANGYLVFTTSAVDLAILTNSIIHASVNRQRCVRGVSGRHRVVSAVINGNVMTITTATRFCCIGANLANTVGTVQRISNVLYPYQFAETARVVIKKTGRPFFGTAGRRPSKCC